MYTVSPGTNLSDVLQNQLFVAAQTLTLTAGEAGV